jgi:SAM-dependent methyltransferase
MKKILFTLDTNVKEGFESFIPLTTSQLPADSVETIDGVNILEKIKDLPAFIDECYRLLVPGGIATFSSPHYASNNAWVSPLTVRAISEASLNFASKDWREQNKFTEVPMIANFEVAGNFAVEVEAMNRSEIARGFFMKHYNNVVRAVVLTLTKK